MASHSHKNFFCFHFSVIPNLVRNLFTFTLAPSTDPETSSGWQFVEAFTVGPFRPPQSASFRIYFGIFFLLLSSLQQILKQVQDDILFSFFCHSEFISESFSFISRVLPTDPETSSGWQFVEAFTVGPFRPPRSASFRIYFGIFFLYSRPSNRSWNKFRMTGGENVFVVNNNKFFVVATT